MLVYSADTQACKIVSRGFKSYVKCKGTIAEGLGNVTQAAQDKVGRPAAKGIKHFGKEFNKEAIEAGKTLERAAQDVGHGLDHFFGEVEKEFCNVMTLGAYKEGDASCGVSAGVGADSEGVYTYNPDNPEDKFRLPNSPHGRDYLVDMQMRFYEYDFEDAFGIRRFLPADYVPGDPWPSDGGPLAAPTASGEVRGKDAKGGGSFLAPRWDEKAERIRFHGGVDYATTPGEPIYAPISGYVVRYKNPRAGFKGLLLRTDNGYTASVFYVVPDRTIVDALKRGERVRVAAGQTAIGTAADVRTHYGPKITNHVHVTLEDPQSRRVSPDGSMVINWLKNGEAARASK